MKCLLTWTSVLVVSLILSATPSFGQMSDDYGFPIESENYTARQSYDRASQGRGLFDRLFRSGPNARNAVVRRFQSGQIYCPSPLLTTGRTSENYRGLPLQPSYDRAAVVEPMNRPTVASDVVMAPAVTKRIAYPRNSPPKALRTATEPSILITSRPCASNRRPR